MHEIESRDGWADVKMSIDLIPHCSKLDDVAIGVEFSFSFL